MAPVPPPVAYDATVPVMMVVAAVAVLHLLYPTEKFETEARRARGGGLGRYYEAERNHAGRDRKDVSAFHYLLLGFPLAS
jgi:hypothetical protein